MPQKLRYFLDNELTVSPYQHGKGLRAVVFDWLHKADPSLSEQVHDANQLKPYTISPLWSNPTVAGRSYFEISILVDEIASLILAGSQQQEQCIRLGNQHFKINSVELDTVKSWDNLLDPMTALFSYYNICLLSPTAHHASGLYRKTIVLPSPELYFGSWFGRWNLYCPCKYRFDPKLLEVIEGQVVISACAGSTQSVKVDEQRVFIGFQGDVRFTLIKAAMIPDEQRIALTALVRFSNFCGTGVETMRGMGQTCYVEG